jgi:hypothetical protein
VRAAEESARGGWRGAGEEERDEGAGERGLGVGRRLEKDESRGELVGEGWEELAEELETQEREGDGGGSGGRRDSQRRGTKAIWKDCGRVDRQCCIDSSCARVEGVLAILESDGSREEDAPCSGPSLDFALSLDPVTRSGLFAHCLPVLLADDTLLFLV